MGEPLASFPQLAAAGGGGRSLAPAQGPGKAGSLTGGPREQERRDTAAQRDQGPSTTLSPTAVGWSEKSRPPRQT